MFNLFIVLSLLMTCYLESSIELYSWRHTHAKTAHNAHQTVNQATN